MATALSLPADPLPTDDELAERVKAGDTAAFDLLHTRYERWLQQTTRRYFLVGGDREDLLQIARIGLWRAAQHYRDREGSAFRSWAWLIVHREIAVAIRHTMRLTPRMLDQAISLSTFTKASDDSPVALADTLASGDPLPDQNLMDREQTRVILDGLAQRLTSMEWQVLMHLLALHSMHDTATAMGLSFKQVDNARLRIRRKARAIREAESLP